MILALLATALAAPRLTVVDEPLHPGQATWIELADDATTAAPRDALVRGGNARSWVAVRPGVWRAVLEPRMKAEAGEVTAGGMTIRRDLVAPPAAAVGLPEQVDAVVGVAQVDLPLSGFDGAREDLRVESSEGRVTIEQVGDRWVARLVPDPLVYPRWALIAVRDQRADGGPTVARVRLRGRPRLPLAVEPGVSLQLEVGGREYGPFTATEAGAIEGRVDQYPGETTAVALLTDSLGNVTRTEIPLVAETEPTLVASVGGELLPGRRPPLFFVSGITPVGAPIAAAPTCRASFGEIPLRQHHPGAWYGALPPLGDPQDLRVVCTAGARQVDFKIQVAPVPARLSLRVWPEELRADFPTAEVRVALEDWRGERLLVDRVTITAEDGHVDTQGGDPTLGRAEYDGSTAVARGRDTVVASYHPPPGSGAPQELELGWSAASPSGFVLSVRALDRLRRPLAGTPVTLAAGEGVAVAVTGEDGWASATLSPEVVSGPIPISARWTGRGGTLARHGFVLPREAASGPLGDGLTARVELSLRPGRIAGLDVDVDPPVLRAGPGAVAWVVVRMEDGFGQPVVDEPVSIEVSEGTIGELHQRADGSLVAEYQPLAVEERREVEITASTEAVHSSARLLLEPRVVRFSLGPWLGATTRFGPKLLPSGGVDLDVRLRNPIVGEALMVRFGVWVTSSSTLVDTGVGPPAELRSTLIPGCFALLLRDDRGPWSVWGGGGVAAGLQHLEVRFGASPVTKGETLLFGPELHAAVARRALGGELAFGLRGAWLQAPATDVGFSGNLGGASATLAYRVVW